MSRRMLKFILGPEVTTFETADEPTFRAVGWQGHHLALWVEGTPVESRPVLTLGAVVSAVATIRTGDPIPDDSEYVGTAAADPATFGMPMVLHVYRHVVR